MPDLLAASGPRLRHRGASGAAADRRCSAGWSLSAALAALLLGRGLRDMAASGLARENYRGRLVAFPAGAPMLACSLLALAPLAVLDDRADLDLLDPELRRWMVYVLGIALLGLLDDALGRGAAADTPRGWRGHARAAARQAASRPGRSRRPARSPWPPTRPRAAARRGSTTSRDLALLLLATNLFNLLDLRPGRVEKAFALLLAGLCLGAWSDRPLELLGTLRRSGPDRRGLHAARARDARRHRLEPDRSARRRSRCWSRSTTPGAGSRWRSSPRSRSTGSFGRSRRSIESIPPLRWLDSLGRVSQGDLKR